MNRVNGLGQALLQRNVIQRREYVSSRPNALWHLDGHHKLILWGFVIHGIVDGYCRSVSLCFSSELVSVLIRNPTGCCNACKQQ